MANRDDEQRAFNGTTIRTAGNLAYKPRDISRNEDGSVVVFDLIANRRDGRGDEFTDKFNCKSISASMSANILTSLHKGMAVKVEGRLEISYWTNKDGDEVPQFTIILDGVDLPLKYRSLQDHSEKFESSSKDDDDEGGGRSRSRKKSRSRDDDDEDEDDDEEETPTRRSSRRSNSSGTRRSGRSASKSDDDEEEETKPRRSRRSTRTKGDAEDEDDEI